MTCVNSIIFGSLLSVSTTVAAWAVEPVQQHNSNAVWFENWTGLRNGQMTISAPNGKITTVFAKSGTPVFTLESEGVVDGVYRYELSAATDKEVEIVNPIDNGRGENASNTAFEPFYTHGHFVVSRGVIITPEEIKEEDN